MRLADWMVKYLKSCGVSTLFQVTGRGSLFISDALARDPEIKAVSLHHEQSAAYAACAQAALDGRLAACVVSSGCAATNAISGVLTAWQDELPVIFISGQNFSSETVSGVSRRFRTYGEQEADVVSIVSSITKKAVAPTSSQECISLIPDLIDLALAPRRGPVWLDLPLDFQSAQVTQELELSQISQRSENETPQPSDLRSIGQQLCSAKRPLILIGSSCNTPRNRESVQRFAEDFEIPVVFEGASPDVYGIGQKWCVGSIGSQGCTRSGNLAIQNADLVLALGCSLRSSTYGELPKDFARQARLILIDIDENECRRDRVRVDEFHRYQISEFLDSLTLFLGPMNIDSWRDICLRWKETFPKIDHEVRSRENENGVDLYDLADALSSVMSEDAVFVTDSGLSQLILPTNIKFKNSQRCIQPFSQGAMGFALPAGVGAAIAAPNKEIVIVTGDGSLMMNLQELETIRYHSLPIKIFVISNGAYAIIRKRQYELFRGRTIGTDPGNGVSIPPIHLLAEVFGMSYGQITSTEMMASGLQNALRSSGPTLWEIQGKWNQSYLHVSRSLDSSGRLVTRPIDNQSPWIDEATYKEELSLLESTVH